MQITQDTVVSLRLRVADAQTGQLLDAPKDPVVYLHGGYGNILPAIEAALDGQAAGHQATLTLPAEQAFGARDEALLRTIPKSEFPPGVKVGGQLRGQLDNGEPHVFNVVKIKGPEVLLDGNHPWAGRSLRFQLNVTGVRAATGEEIAHRHVHGDGGHHH
ncbi:FKBP-type peptidyl-prolyl cis-trans isomerase [Pseudacidovorax intermedius]|uniref:peptidylprolyl isomerase n=1 Tax=Pseudacidovorax intermedius TaxID=433924 RepID=A0A147GNP9_9BURK|nr:FKBP-type peptidyl-prolyl cis-trans isomerase [Pseudacidovorax intermedius]KTT15552.1 peptidylprolyl isomerase [Pseudacidovorax intermedius]